VTLTFTLPIPPSSNHAYRRFTTKSGRRMNVLTNKARTWQEQAHHIARNAAHKCGWTCPQGDWVTVRITVHWPDKRRRDVSNLHKLLADSLEGIAYDDDRWCLFHDQKPDIDRADPRVDVEVERA